MAWEVSSVMLTVEWPRRSETTFGVSSAAPVCRRYVGDRGAVFAAARPSEGLLARLHEAIQAGCCFCLKAKHQVAVGVHRDADT
jgi:hypothetical protein